jgi:hypothetical protein
MGSAQLASGHGGVYLLARTGTGWANEEVLMNDT